MFRDSYVVCIYIYTNIMNVLRTGMDMSISHIRIMGMVHKLYKELRSNIFASLRVYLLFYCIACEYVHSKQFLKIEVSS